MYQFLMKYLTKKNLQQVLKLLLIFLFVLSLSVAYQSYSNENNSDDKEEKEEETTTVDLQDVSLNGNSIIDHVKSTLGHGEKARVYLSKNSKGELHAYVEIGTAAGDYTIHKHLVQTDSGIEERNIGLKPKNGWWGNHIYIGKNRTDGRKVERRSGGVSNKDLNARFILHGSASAHKDAVRNEKHENLLKNMLENGGIHSVRAVATTDLKDNITTYFKHYKEDGSEHSTHQSGSGSFEGTLFDKSSPNYAKGKKVNVSDLGVTNDNILDTYSSNEDAKADRVKDLYTGTNLIDKAFAHYKKEADGMSADKAKELGVTKSHAIFEYMFGQLSADQARDFGANKFDAMTYYAGGFMTPLKAAGLGLTADDVIDDYLRDKGGINTQKTRKFLTGAHKDILSEATAKAETDIKTITQSQLTKLKSLSGDDVGFTKEVKPTIFTEYLKGDTLGINQNKAKALLEGLALTSVVTEATTKATANMQTLTKTQIGRLKNLSNAIKAGDGIKFVESVEPSIFTEYLKGDITGINQNKAKDLLEGLALTSVVTGATSQATANMKTLTKIKMGRLKSLSNAIKSGDGAKFVESVEPAIFTEYLKGDTAGINQNKAKALLEGLALTSVVTGATSQATANMKTLTKIKMGRLKSLSNAIKSGDGAKFVESVEPAIFTEYLKGDTAGINQNKAKALLEGLALTSVVTGATSQATANMKTLTKIKMGRLKSLSNAIKSGDGAKFVESVEPAIFTEYLKGDTAGINQNKAKDLLEGLALTSVVTGATSQATANMKTLTKIKMGRLKSLSNAIKSGDGAKFVESVEPAIFTEYLKGDTAGINQNKAKDLLEGLALTSVVTGATSQATANMKTLTKIKMGRLKSLSNAIKSGDGAKFVESVEPAIFTEYLKGDTAGINQNKAKALLEGLALTSVVTGATSQATANMKTLTKIKMGRLKSLSNAIKSGDGAKFVESVEPAIFTEYLKGDTAGINQNKAKALLEGLALTSVVTGATSQATANMKTLTKIKMGRLKSLSNAIKSGDGAKFVESVEPAIFTEYLKGDTAGINQNKAKALLEGLALTSVVTGATSQATANMKTLTKIKMGRLKSLSNAIKSGDGAKFVESVEPAIFTEYLKGDTAGINQNKAKDLLEGLALTSVVTGATSQATANMKTLTKIKMGRLKSLSNAIKSGDGAKFVESVEPAIFTEYLKGDTAGINQNKAKDLLEGLALTSVVTGATSQATANMKTLTKIKMGRLKSLSNAIKSGDGAKFVESVEPAIFTEYLKGDTAGINQNKAKDLLEGLALTSVVTGATSQATANMKTLTKIKMGRLKSLSNAIKSGDGAKFVESVEPAIFTEYLKGDTAGINQNKAKDLLEGLALTSVVTGATSQATANMKTLTKIKMGRLKSLSNAIKSGDGAKFAKVVEPAIFTEYLKGDTTGINQNKAKDLLEGLALTSVVTGATSQATANMKTLTKTQIGRLKNLSNAIKTGDGIKFVESVEPSIFTEYLKGDITGINQNKAKDLLEGLALTSVVTGATSQATANMKTLTKIKMGRLKSLSNAIKSGDGAKFAKVVEPAIFTEYLKGDTTGINQNKAKDLLEGLALTSVVTGATSQATANMKTLTKTQIGRLKNLSNAIKTGDGIKFVESVEPSIFTEYLKGDITGINQNKAKDLLEGLALTSVVTGATSQATANMKTLTKIKMGRLKSLSNAIKSGDGAKFAKVVEPAIFTEYLKGDTTGINQNKAKDLLEGLALTSVVTGATSQATANMKTLTKTQIGRLKNLSNAIKTGDGIKFVESVEPSIFTEYLKGDITGINQNKAKDLLEGLALTSVVTGATSQATANMKTLTKIKMGRLKSLSNAIKSGDGAKFAKVVEPAIFTEYLKGDTTGINQNKAKDLLEGLALTSVVTGATSQATANMKTLTKTQIGRLKNLSNAIKTGDGIKFVESVEPSIFTEYLKGDTTGINQNKAKALLEGLALTSVVTGATSQATANMKTLTKTQIGRLKNLSNAIKIGDGIKFAKAIEPAIVTNYMDGDISTNKAKTLVGGLNLTSIVTEAISQAKVNVKTLTKIKMGRLKSLSNAIKSGDGAKFVESVEPSIFTEYLKGDTTGINQNKAKALLEGLALTSVVTGATSQATANMKTLTKTQIGRLKNLSNAIKTGDGSNFAKAIEPAIVTNYMDGDISTNKAKTLVGGLNLTSIVTEAISQAKVNVKTLTKIKMGRLKSLSNAIKSGDGAKFAKVVEPAIFTEYLKGDTTGINQNKAKALLEGLALTSVVTEATTKATANMKTLTKTQIGRLKNLSNAIKTGDGAKFVKAVEPAIVTNHLNGAINANKAESLLNGLGVTSILNEAIHIVQTDIKTITNAQLTNLQTLSRRIKSTDGDSFKKGTKAIILTNYKLNEITAVRAKKLGIIPAEALADYKTPGGMDVAKAKALGVTSKMGLDAFKLAKLSKEKARKLVSVKYVLDAFKKNNVSAYKARQLVTKAEALADYKTSGGMSAAKATALGVTPADALADYKQAKNGMSADKAEALGVTKVSVFAAYKSGSVNADKAKAFVTPAETLAAFKRGELSAAQAAALGAIIPKPKTQSKAQQKLEAQVAAIEKRQSSRANVKPKREVFLGRPTTTKKIVTGTKSDKSVRSGKSQIKWYSPKTWFAKEATPDQSAAEKSTTVKKSATKKLKKTSKTTKQKQSTTKKSKTVKEEEDKELVYN